MSKNENYTAEEKRVIDFFFTLYNEMARRSDILQTTLTPENDGSKENEKE